MEITDPWPQEGFLQEEMLLQKGDTHVSAQQ